MHFGTGPDMNPNYFGLLLDWNAKKSDIMALTCKNNELIQIGTESDIKHMYEERPLSGRVQCGSAFC